jgi:hypothetical protein
MTEHGAPLQAQAAMGRQQGITGDLWPHLAIAQNKVGKDGEDGFARGALEPPDGEPTQANTGVMGVARQAAPAATGRLVFQLEAKRQNAGEDTLNKRLTIAQELNVGCLVLQVDSNGSVFAGRVGCVSHGSPSSRQVCAV